MDIPVHLRESRSTRPVAFIGLVTAIILFACLAFAVLRSLRQRIVVMAVYPEGSLNVELVKRYQQVMARKGLEVRLDPSAGAVESLGDLRNPKSGVSVALVPGGITTKQDSPDLVSLGTVLYQPLWIFSRAELSHDHFPIAGRRISLGPEGSSSHVLAREVLGRVGWIDPKATTLLSLPPAESAQALLHGDIDTAIFVDGWESPVVQQLLRTKGISLENMPRADALVRVFPYLNKLVLPAGAVDLAEPSPHADVTLIGPKASLVVRNDLHAAIQYRLLEAAAEIHSTPSMFRTAGQFPAPESVDLPLSPYAQDFYKTGSPFLLRHLPFWLAVVLEQPLVWLIPFLVILFPVFRLAPAVYDWAERRRIYRLYSELKRLEDEMSDASARGRRDDFIERLNRLETRASHLSVPLAFRPLVYALRHHIDLVRQKSEKPISS
jgi:TRAP-type uncharacterized transport system substrate-binding protein